jgi:hypothetical protein
LFRETIKSFFEIRTLNKKHVLKLDDDRKLLQRSLLSLTLIALLRAYAIKPFTIVKIAMFFIDSHPSLV